MLIYKPSIDVFMGKSEKVTLLFNKEVSHLVDQTIFHHTQKSRKLADGSTQISLSVGIGVGLAYWVLSFGERVKVIEPHSLSAAVAKLAKQTAELYTD